jgi:hypothetical protein
MQMNSEPVRSNVGHAALCLRAAHDCAPLYTPPEALHLCKMLCSALESTGEIRSALLSMSVKALSGSAV